MTDIEKLTEIAKLATEIEQDLIRSAGAESVELPIDKWRRILKAAQSGVEAQISHQKYIIEYGPITHYNINEGFEKVVCALYGKEHITINYTPEPTND